MSVDKEVVQKVAKLAYLNLSESEEQFYLDQLGKVLGYINKIEKAPDSLDPSWRADTQNAPTLERADQAQSQFSVSEKISVAPESSGSAFCVPKVIE